MTVKEIKEYLNKIPDDYIIYVDDAYNQTSWKVDDETEIHVSNEDKTVTF